MAQVTHFFAGANSGAGFRNLFGELTDLEETRDLMILTGGPGVGKNTFMREIGRTLEEAGAAVEYLWCSGDPDSLDAVVLPELHCAVADGTAPHVLTPRYPGAVDRLVDLGQFCDLTALKAQSGEIREAVRACREPYGRAYHALRAAREVELEAVEMAAQSFDAVRAERRFRGIAQRELPKKGEGRGRLTRRFLGSITWKGYVWRFDSVETLCPRVYELEDSWELAGEGLRFLAETALERGWDVILCPSPEELDRPEHLLIPELGLGFVTSAPGELFPGKPLRRVRLDALTEVEGKARLRFCRRMAGLLRKEAAEALGEAHSLHDRLEALYRPHVDFQGVRTLAALEAGRLLGFLE